MTTTLTEDRFLNGQLIIQQPAEGYRAATDPVLLAAACGAKGSQTVLDVGCGVGVAALCLKTRVPGVAIIGIEFQAVLAELATANAAKNSLDFEVICADLRDNPLKHQSFDHIITNPPYFEASTGNSPQNSSKSLAFVEGFSLADWITLSAKRLRQGGSFTIILPVARLPVAISTLAQGHGGISILPIAARQNQAAKRVIIRAIKASGAPSRLLAPFVMHEGLQHDQDTDSFSDRARQILRNGAAIDFE